MAKPNAKSIRYSDEVAQIIESAPGKGFNEQFEGLILDYNNTIPQRLAQLESLNKRITQKKKELETLQNLESKVRSMTIDLDVIANLIPRVARSIGSVSHEINQAQLAADEIEIQKFEKAFKNFTS